MDGSRQFSIFGPAFIQYCPECCRATVGCKGNTLDEDFLACLADWLSDLLNSKSGGSTRHLAGMALNEELPRPIIELLGLKSALIHRERLTSEYCRGEWLIKIESLKSVKTTGCLRVRLDEH